LSDWENDAGPHFNIERVGQEGVAPPRRQPHDVARALDRAANWVEKSVGYWNAYLLKAIDRAEPNKVVKAQGTPGGASNLMYGSTCWDLDEDQVLLIVSEPPDADYWNFTIHNLHWFDSGDYANRQTSLTGHQMHLDGDGRFRLVLAHRDPGVPNWIDTEGRQRGMIAFRYLSARSNPTPEGRVLSRGELRKHLPDDHPTIDAEARRSSLARRREALWNRFR
jgi:hypothetical protein